jgi:hypothetical protein
MNESNKLCHTRNLLLAETSAIALELLGTFRRFDWLLKVAGSGSQVETGATPGWPTNIDIGLDGQWNGQLTRLHNRLVQKVIVNCVYIFQSYFNFIKVVIIIHMTV